MSQIETLLTEIEARAKDIPHDIRADWDGSNHYELQAASVYGWWWCTIPHIFTGQDVNWCETEEGRRLGKFMDFGCAARTDIPRLVAALRVAVGWIEYLHDGISDTATQEIEAALKGEDHA